MSLLIAGSKIPRRRECRQSPCTRGTETPKTDGSLLNQPVQRRVFYDVIDTDGYKRVAKIVIFEFEKRKKLSSFNFKNTIRWLKIGCDNYLFLDFFLIHQSHSDQVCREDFISGGRCSLKNY